MQLQKGIEKMKKVNIENLQEYDLFEGRDIYIKYALVRLPSCLIALVERHTGKVLLEFNNINKISKHVYGGTYDIELVSGKHKLMKFRYNDGRKMIPFFSEEFDKIEKIMYEFILIKVKGEKRLIHIGGRYATVNFEFIQWSHYIPEINKGSGYGIFGLDNGKKVIIKKEGLEILFEYEKMDTYILGKIRKDLADKFVKDYRTVTIKNKKHILKLEDFKLSEPFDSIRTVRENGAICERNGRKCFLRFCDFVSTEYYDDMKNTDNDEYVLIMDNNIPNLLRISDLKKTIWELN